MNRCPTCLRAIGKSRSQNENRYYWKILSIAASETGNDKDTLHRLMTDMHMDKEPVTINGKTMLVPRSTTDLTTSEFEEYLLKVRSFFAQEGIMLPLPNQQDLPEYP